MKVLGLDLAKGQLRYTLLDGTLSSPVLLEKEKLVVPELAVPELMDWFESTFENLISRLKPEQLAYRIKLKPKKDQLFYLIFPYAVLNLKCYQHDIPVTSFTLRQFGATKFGYDKKDDMYEVCDKVFGKLAPNWDNNQKQSLLAAWLKLAN